MGLPGKLILTRRGHQMMCEHFTQGGGGRVACAQERLNGFPDDAAGGPALEGFLGVHGFQNDDGSMVGQGPLTWAGLPMGMRRGSYSLSQGYLT